MKLAILADIHGNLEALEAVLLAAADAGVSRVVSLGDVVGYGADPLGCTYRLQEAGAALVLGNHDRAVLEPAEIQAFSYAAGKSEMHSCIHHSLHKKINVCWPGTRKGCGSIQIIFILSKNFLSHGFENATGKIQVGLGNRLGGCPHCYPFTDLSGGVRHCTDDLVVL